MQLKAPASAAQGGGFFCYAAGGRNGFNMAEADPALRARSAWQRLAKFAEIIISVYYFYVIAGALLAALIYGFRETSDHIVAAHAYFISVYPLTPPQSFLVLLLLASSFATFLYLRARRRWRKIVGLFDDFLLEYARLTLQIDQLIIPDAGKDEINSKQYYELLLAFDQFLRRSVGIIHKIFTKYTGFHCHVSIKTYRRDTGQVRRVVRDHMSSDKDKRHAIDEHKPAFHYKENTAFKVILEDPCKGSFRSNHLLLRYLSGRYDNAHAGWYKLYRAAVVVPITP